MKPIVLITLKSLLLSILFIASALNFNSQVTYTWNGTVSSEWNNGSNWTPVGPPLNTDHVIIVASPNDPSLSNDVTIEDFTINSGALNLAGFKITSEGNHSFSGGNILNGTFQSLTGVLTTFSATTFDANIDITSERILLNGGVFNNPVVLEQNGTTNANGTGNATFNAPLDFTLSGTAYFRTNGNNTFNDDVFLTNNGGNWILLERSTGSVYNGNVTFTNNVNSNIRVAYAGTTTFNGDLEFNNTSTGQIVFCEFAASSAIFGAGVQISEGPLGFDSGILILRNITQTDATPQTLSFAGTSDIRSINNVWDGAISFTASSVLSTNTIFNGNTYIENNGVGISSSGGNTFDQTTTLVNSSGNEMRFGVTNPDIFNGELSLLNSGTSTLQVAYNSVGNAFNNNVIFENTSTGNVYISVNGGTSTLGNGFDMQIGGLGFSDGILQIENLTQIGLTPQSLTVGTNARITLENNTFDAPANFTSGRMFLLGNVFNNVVSLEKIGANNDNSTGGNIFNQTSTIVNSGSGRLLFANTSPDIFNDETTIISNGSSQIWLAHNSIGNQFNHNIIVESTGTSNGVEFGRGGSGDVTLANGFTVTVGAGGFSTGTLRFRNFTQVGATAQSISLTGTGYFINQDAEWNGDVTFIAPQLITQGTLYNGTVYLEKNGAGNNNSQGGNTFNQDATIVYSGSNNFIFATVDPDIFNGTTTVINNNGVSQIRLAHGASGNQFNGDIIIESINGGGIAFSLGNGDATLAATHTISVGGAGFNSGTLTFENFTQVGATAQNLTLTGTGYIYQQDSDWGGDVNFVAPRYYTIGTTYNGIANIEKSGSGDDASAGNNTFVQNATLICSGDGYLGMGWTNPDLFQGDLTLQNTGSSHIYIAYNSSGNIIEGNVLIENTSNNGIVYFNQTNSGDLLFNGDIEINSSLSANGVRFGDALLNASFIQQAVGTSITIGAGGFNNGELRFVNFTKLGADPVNLTLSNNGYFRSFESVWNGNVQFVSPRIYTRGSTYNGTSYLEKTGTTDDQSAGNNVFNDITTIVNSGIRYFGMGFTNPDIFNADVNIRNTGTFYVTLAHNSSGNQFNGNVQLESDNGQGVRIGSGNGSSTLATGMQFSIGALGFSEGELGFRNVTQIGNTPQNLTLTSNATFESYDAVWNGPVDFRSPRHYTRGTTYNNSAYLEKTGTGNDASVGGNTFNDETSIVNSGVGYFMPANGTGNDFNANVSFIQNNTGTILPCYNSASTFAGDINIDYSNGQIYFGAVTNGRVVMDGNGVQNINDLGGSNTPRFRDLEVSKTGGEVVLNMPIQIEIELDLNSENIITDGTNLLLMTDNSFVSSVSDASYVEGPVRKIGNDAFEFPVGKGGFYRPISISAPSSNSHHFTAEFFNTEADAVDMQEPATIDAAIENISDCEHWILDRTNGTSNVNVTLSYRPYGANGCSGVADLASLTIARWDDGIQEWVNHPGTAVGNPSGSITTNSAVTDFSPFALATTSNSNPLPIELVNFKAKANGKQVDLEWQTASEINNEFFTIERSIDGLNFEIVTIIEGAGNSTALLDYKSVDANPYTGTSFYRLKQTDFDGAFEYSEVRKVEIEVDGVVNIYPNPVQINEKRFIVDVSGFQNGADEIIILDALGKIVYSKSENLRGQIDIETSILNSGIYFVRVVVGANLYHKKVVVK